MTTTEMAEPSLAELAGPTPCHTPAGRLAGRVCLVVGATSGIGRATALRMAGEGAAAVVAVVAASMSGTKGSPCFTR